MENSKRILIIMAMAFYAFVNCNTISANAKTIKSDQITINHVEPYKYNRSFIIKFSNVIYIEKGKTIKIPIFQGKYEDVLYDDFINYCIKNKLLEPKVMQSGFMIKTKKGEIRKTFHDFLAFYKSNIFRNIDIEKPTVMSLGSTDWIIKYDFTINGVPCYMSILLTPRDEDLKKAQKDMIMKSVYEIIPEEKMDEPEFSYNIFVGSKSTDR